MKKLLIPIIIIAVLAISPWFIGAKTEDALQNFVTQIETNNPALKLKLNNYDRGAFGATGELHVAYSEALFPENNEMPEEVRKTLTDGVVVLLDVSHGPILTSPSLGFGLSYIDFRVDTSSENLANFLAKTNNTEILYGTAKLSLAGNFSMVPKAPKFDYSDEESVANFGGAVFTYDVKSDLSYVIGGTVEESLFASNDSEIKLSQIDLSSQGLLDKTLDWGTGDAKLTMDSLSIVGEETVDVSGSSLIINVIDSGEDLTDIEYDLAIDNISGSAIEDELNNIKYAMTVKRLKKSALKALNRLSANPELNQNPEAMQAAVSNTVIEMLTTSPTLEINQIAFEQGDATFFDMNGNLSIDSDKLGPPELLQVNPLSAIPAVSAKLNASFSPDLIAKSMQAYMAFQTQGMEMTEEQAESMKAEQLLQAQNMVHGFVQMGYLNQTEKGLSTEATFENGQLLVNGQPLPLFGM